MRLDHIYKLEFHRSKNATLEYRRALEDFFLYCRYYYHLCSDQLASLISLHSVPARQTKIPTHSHVVQLKKPRTTQCVRYFILRSSSLWKFLPSLQSFKYHKATLPLDLHEVMNRRISVTTYPCLQNSCLNIL